MAYDDFTLDAITQQFQLDLRQERDLYAGVAPVPPSPLLVEILTENVPLAVDIATEKARSEFIIAPVLSEVKRQSGKPLSLFSGVEFNVDFDQGLRGTCDFLFSLSPVQLLIQAPVVAIVEAKRDNISSGIGQCLAEMLAAQTFNERRGNAIPVVYGVVTTGSLWKFLRLSGLVATVDEREYHIDQVAHILGILLSMVTPPDGLRPAVSAPPL